jgi:uncharacterized membrane-anchored protein YjiN (DUF445 family)
MESKNSTKKQSKVPEGLENIFNESNIGDMMREVNSMLQKNPDMIKKVSKCVNNIFENENLMQKLVSEINSNITPEEEEDSEDETALIKDQTLSNNSSGDNLTAESNESKQ